jgi:hypothetical protein
MTDLHKAAQQALCGRKDFTDDPANPVVRRILQQCSITSK